jgi:hypothetical protein
VIDLVDPATTVNALFAYEPPPPPPPPTLMPPPPPPATTSVFTEVTPGGTIHPPADVRYERGKVTTVSAPLVEVVLTSTKSGLPTVVR